MRGLRTALLLALTLPGCGAPPPVHIASGCERLDLDEGSCLLPWPSSQFLVADPSTETGRRIELPEGEMPANSAMPPVAVAAGAWNTRDGFSAMTSMMVRIEGQIDDSVLPSWRAIDRSLDEHSPTLLLDVTNLDAPVAVRHFAEIQTSDVLDPVDAAFTTLYIRPAARLEEIHHYVVAVRRLEHSGHTRPRSSVTFAALRDGTVTDSPALEARRSIFERDVFGPLLRTNHVDRSELIVAWDFWTGSGPTAWGDLVAMRDQAFEGVDSLRCTITVPDYPPADPSMRVVEGTFDVPYFMDADCAPGHLLVDLETDHLQRAGGVPMRHGICQARFAALLPNSIAGAPSVPLVEYGHGLRNTFEEVAIAGVVPPVLAATHSIGIATDAYGLSASDTTAIIFALQELSDFRTIDDRVLQGVIAQLVLPHVFAHACAGLPDLHASGLNIDGAHVRWIGNSQGAIMGPTIAALEPPSSRMDRLALGVGGISYPIMLPRSCDWPMLEGILIAAYPSRIDRDLLMVMFASHWDLFEGATFAPHIAGALAPLPGSDTNLPDVLYQIAVNDPGTPEVSGEMAARTMSLPVLSSSATSPSGLLPATMASTSAFASFDGGFVRVPDGPVPSSSCPADGGAHEWLRRQPEAQQQIEDFFNTGALGP